MKRLSRSVWIFAAWSLVANCVAATAQPSRRAVVADLVNNSKDKHSTVIRVASDTLAVEITKSGNYEVVARQEVDRAAKARRFSPPYTEDDLLGVAKDIDAQYLVTGEIHHVDVRTKGGQKEVEVGMIVRVTDVALGEIVNGAAERGIATESGGSAKSEVLLVMDAATNAAARVAMKLGANKPIDGTVMNTAGSGLVVINRGAGHGVKGKQEFVVLREGIRVGRLRTYKIYPMYSEMSVVENTAGIRPEDKAISVFPEPKFPGKTTR